MRSFPNPVILDQLSARQPPLLLIVIMYILPFWLLAPIFKALLFLPPYADFARNSPESHQTIFFICQALLICSTAIISSIKFPTALWKPRPSTCHKSLVLLITSLAALYYVFRAWRLIGFIVKATNSPNVHLDAIHDSFWLTLPYGDSLNGVRFSSVVLVFGPVFEEIIFSGFLLNLALKNYGLLPAVVAVPIIFTFAHVPQQGFGIHLLPIFCSGVAFVFIRLISGNLFYSVLSHMVINCIFLFPGWIEAYIFFNS